jgi:hypothetical protein
MTRSCFSELLDQVWFVTLGNDTQTLELLLYVKNSRFGWHTLSSTIIGWLLQSALMKLTKAMSAGRGSCTLLTLLVENCRLLFL